MWFRQAQPPVVECRDSGVSKPLSVILLVGHKIKYILSKVLKWQFWYCTIFFQSLHGLVVGSGKFCFFFVEKRPGWDSFVWYVSKFICKLMIWTSFFQNILFERKLKNKVSVVAAFEYPKVRICNIKNIRRYKLNLIWRFFSLNSWITENCALCGEIGMSFPE